MKASETQYWAEKLFLARDKGRTIKPITDEQDLSMRDAYAIQQALTQMRLESGQRIVGWKLGYTSLAMRRQMAVDDPNFGPLTDAMLLRDGDEVKPTLMQPRVEPEIGLRLVRPLVGDISVDDVLAASGDVFACLEVVDSVYAGYRFHAEDNTADGSSAAQVVIGPSLGTNKPLDEVEVVLEHNGEEVARALGSAASGHPANGVVWLVDQLASIGQHLKAGQIVITGGLTSALPLDPTDRVRAIFDGRVAVSVTRSAGESTRMPL